MTFLLTALLLAAGTPAGHAFPLDPDVLAVTPTDRAHYREAVLRGWSRAGALIYQLTHSQREEDDCGPTFEWSTALILVREGGTERAFRKQATIEQAGAVSTVDGELQAARRDMQCKTSPAAASEYDKAAPDGEAAVAGLQPLTPVCKEVEKNGCASPDGKWILRVRHETGAAVDQCRDESLSYVLVPARGARGTETPLLKLRAGKAANCGVLRDIFVQASWSADSRRVATATVSLSRDDQTVSESGSAARLDVFDAPPAK